MPLGRKSANNPRQLLISILSNLPTRSLLQLASVNRHFYSITLRIVKQRLHRATSLPDRRLILECYPPSEKLYTPYFYCDFLYTDSLGGQDDEGAAQDPPPEQPTADRRGLGEIYSHFRPIDHREHRRRTRRTRRRNHPQGSSSSSSASTSTTPAAAAAGGETKKATPLPFIDVYLDSDDHSSPLCAVTSLVRVGPKPDLFLSHVNFSDEVIRVSRDWLARRAGRALASLLAERRGETARDEEAVLWADAARTVGLRFRVWEKDDFWDWEDYYVLMANDEEVPVAYRLEFEELLLRTGTLLMMVEEEEELRAALPEARALVIAGF